MVRTLLVNDVQYAGVHLPSSATVVVTLRQDESGDADWEASIALPGPVDLPERGDFSGCLESGRVTGGAILVRSELTMDDHGVHTVLAWRGTGALVR